MPPSLLDASAQEGARLVALRHVEQANEACQRLRDPDDGEALHDLRVALRRLRSGVRAYDAILGESVGKKLMKRVVRLTSRTAPGRDAEVQLAWVHELSAELPPSHTPGVSWLARQLERQRDRAYARVREDLAARFEKLEGRLRERLSSYSRVARVGEVAAEPRFASVSAEVIAAEAAVLDDALTSIEGEEDQDRLHRARIRGKRLRYLIEPWRREGIEGAEEAVRRLKALQDLLGDLNDLANLAGIVGQALEDAAVDRARELREAAAAGEVEQALSRDERPGLMGLLTRASDDRAALFARLTTFIAGERSKLRDDVETVCARLAREPEQAKSVEIERKYLLTALPPACAEVEASELDQGYLPGERLIERVRRSRDARGERFVRTVKLGEGLVRIEVEEECDAELFGKLWALTLGRRVQKRRYTIDGPDGLTWEIDEFTDRDLVLAEVELPTEDTEVHVPGWLEPYVERDVTGEAEYVNANLAR